MSWDELAARMDRDVDSHLGDCIQYAVDGTNFKDVHGFVMDEVEEIGLDGIDESLGSRKRVKIAKSKVATILTTHRIKHARLGDGVFKPGNSDPYEDSRYWIFDVQKVVS